MTASLARRADGGDRAHRGRAACSVRVPLLMLHGEADPLCPPRGNAQSSTDSCAVGGAPARVYPELRHEIFNEPEQEQVFEDVLGVGSGERRGRRLAWRRAHPPRCAGTRAHGRRRREAGDAARVRRARRGADGAGDARARSRRDAAEGRRARHRAHRGDPGGQAHRRVDPARATRLPLDAIEVELRARPGRLAGRDRGARARPRPHRRRDGGAGRGRAPPASPSTTCARRSTAAWASTRCGSCASAAARAASAGPGEATPRPLARDRRSATATAGPSSGGVRRGSCARGGGIRGSAPRDVVVAIAALRCSRPLLRAPLREPRTHVDLIPTDKAGWSPATSSRSCAGRLLQRSHAARRDSPPGAKLDLFYVRASFQKRYEQADGARRRRPAQARRTPASATPSRSAPALDGYRIETVHVPVRSDQDEITIDLKPLDNTLTAVAHTYFAGREGLTFLTKVPAQVRLQKGERLLHRGARRRRPARAARPRSTASRVR